MSIFTLKVLVLLIFLDSVWPFFLILNSNFKIFFNKLISTNTFLAAIHAMYRWLYFASQKIVVINQPIVSTVLTSLVVLRKAKFASFVTKPFRV